VSESPVPTAMKIHSFFITKFHPFFLQATKALRESRGIFLLYFIDLCTRRVGRVSTTPRPRSTPGKDPVPIVQEVGWAPVPVWTGAENLAPIGIRSPDRPARSQSLYRLSYRAHFITKHYTLIIFGEAKVVLVRFIRNYIYDI
jgi:hypothetical protein